uniref:glycoside hydrolase family 95 protein n=1 Tax=Draconibacterium sp. TaxID=1965318 RepID=UPI003564EFDF
MNKSKLVLAIILVLSAWWSCDTGGESTKFHLIYDEPADKWTEALPIGNGRLGAMIYGEVQQEHIQFNEETLWTGEPHDYSHKGASNYLDEIRQLLADGKQREAQNLASEKFMSVPLHQKAYQPFGDILIDFHDHENFSNYSRALDIEKAISTVSYQVDDTKFIREVFASHPDQVIVIHLTSDRKKALNFDVLMDALHEQKTLVARENTMELEVKVKDGALYGVAVVKVETNGKVNAGDSKLHITEASEATIYLSAATNYINYNDVSADAKALANNKQEQAGSKKYTQIKADHIADYQQLYNRFKIDFGDNGQSAVATDKRIVEFGNSAEDPQLLALY